MPERSPIQFLSQSPDRARLLAHLAESPGSPRDIADVLPLSHRSVQRNLSQLVERGWVEKRAGSYRLTTSGALVAERHADYVEALETVDRFDPLFRHLPDREHAPDPAWLGDATVVVATPDQPQAPVTHYVEAVRELADDRIAMISPVLSRLYHDAHAKLILDGVTTELVMAAETVATARSLNPAEFEFVVRVPLLRLYEHPGPVEFGLTVGKERALLGAYDAEGSLRACADCRHPAFVSWAEALYDRYRERATPV